MLWYFIPNDDGLLKYCPQTVPDYTITFDIIYTYTGVDYCPQSVPDNTITYSIVNGYTAVGYCPQTTPDYSFAQAP